MEKFRVVYWNKENVKETFEIEAEDCVEALNLFMRNAKYSLILRIEQENKYKNLQPVIQQKEEVKNPADEKYKISDALYRKLKRWSGLFGWFNTIIISLSLLFCLYEAFTVHLLFLVFPLILSFFIFANIKLIISSKKINRFFENESNSEEILSGYASFFKIYSLYLIGSFLISIICLIIGLGFTMFNNMHY